MSTIRVDNFGPSAGGTTYSARGIAKAWVNFNGTGTVAVRDSDNLSSITDNTTGDYSINVTNAFSAADYSVTGDTTLRATNTGTLTFNIMRGMVGGVPDIVTPTASSVRVGMAQQSASNNSDAAYVCVNFHGDLA